MSFLAPDEAAALRVAADVESLIAKQHAAGILDDKEHAEIARDVAAGRRLATRPVLNLKTLRTEGIPAGPEPAQIGAVAANGKTAPVYVTPGGCTVVVPC